MVGQPTRSGHGRARTTPPSRVDGNVAQGTDPKEGPATPTDPNVTVADEAARRYFLAAKRVGGRHRFTFLDWPTRFPEVPLASATAAELESLERYSERLEAKVATLLKFDEQSAAMDARWREARRRFG